jgi:hypothetical protein
MNILFIENFDNNKDLSYINRLNLFINNIDYYNINVHLNIDFNHYDKFIFGKYSLPFYKNYDEIKKYNIDKNINYLINNFKKDKYILLENLHSNYYQSIYQLSKYLSSNKINIIFTYYDCFEAKIIRKYIYGINNYHIPHYLNLNDYVKYKNIIKNNDILFIRFNNTKIYPEYNVLLNIINKSKYNIDYIDIFFNDKDYHNKNKILSKIANSKITLISTSKYNYLYKIYMEILYLDSFLISDIPNDLYKLFNNDEINLNNYLFNIKSKIFKDKLDQEDKIISKIDNLLNGYNSQLNANNSKVITKYIEDNLSSNKYVHALESIY